MLPAGDLFVYVSVLIGDLVAAQRHCSPAPGAARSSSALIRVDRPGQIPRASPVPARWPCRRPPVLASPAM